MSHKTSKTREDGGNRQGTVRERAKKKLEGIESEGCLTVSQ